MISTQAGQPAAPGDILDLPNEEARHIQTVLRAAPDAVLNLTDGRGYRYTGMLVSGRRSHPAVKIISCERDPTDDQAPLLVLAVAVVKGKRFEWALEKACELGAHVVIPLKTEFGVVQPGGGRGQRWTAIFASAVKQCGRCVMPELIETRHLGRVLADAAGPVWYGAAPGEERQRGGARPSRTFQPAVDADNPPTWTVCIGPEGGWSPGELDQFEEAGAIPLDLGPHVLRTETAATAALVVLQQRRQEWLTRQGES